MVSTPPVRRASDRCIVIGSAAILFFLLAWIWTSPRGAFVLVVGNPFSTEQSLYTIISGADGAFVSGGSLPWLAVAHSDAPAFAARLKRAGALFVLNANIKSICS